MDSRDKPRGENNLRLDRLESPSCPRLGLAAWMAMLVVAALLRGRCFHSYAVGWDSCEYVYAAERHLLPHSPYILHLWLGLLTSSFAPAATGLSAVSLVCGLAAVFLMARLVHRQSGSHAASLLAGSSLACFTVCVWYSGNQEVYSLQMALALAALLAAHRSERALGAGLLFGAAYAAHSGTIFLVPAMACAVVWRRDSHPPWRRRMRELAVIGMAALALPLLCYVWAYCVSDWGAAGGASAFFHYLSGMAPLRYESGSLGGTAVRAVRLIILPHLDQAMVISPFSLVVVASTILLVLVRGRVKSLLWLFYGIPYMAYLVAVAPHVDPGVSMVYLVVPLAAFLGLAGGELLRWARASTSPRPPPSSGMAAAGASTGEVLIRSVALLGFTCVAVVSIMMPLARTITLATSIPSRSTFFGSEPQRTLLRIRASIPSNAVIVQPPGIDNVNFAPCYSGLRPIIYQDGTFSLLRPGRWIPLYRSSFEVLTDDRLRGLLQDGVEVVSIVPDPFRALPRSNSLVDAGYGWRRQTLPASGGLSVYILERASALP